MPDDAPKHTRTDDRKTIDLCDHQREGSRCMRERGHPGRHECPRWQGSGYVTWD